MLGNHIHRMLWFFIEDDQAKEKAAPKDRQFKSPET
jgi:hypothetical protein